MKKLTGVLVCLLLFTFISSARIIEVADAGITDKLRAVIAAKNASAPAAPGGCLGNDTKKDSEETGEAAIYNIGQYDADKYVATRFQAGSTYVMCRVELELRDDIGDPAYNLTVYIYDDAAGPHPDTAPISGQDSTSDTVDAVAVTGSTSDISFTGLSVAITSGSYYWIVVMADTPDASHNAGWVRGTYNAAKYSDRSTDGATFINQANGANNFKTYD